MTMWDTFCQALRGKRVLVFGLGLQGGGTQSANTLIQAGAQVRATDSKSREELTSSLADLNPAVTTTLGQHTLEDIEWADIILKNPAVPYSHPLIQKALAQKKLVVTETAWALQFLRDQVIGVTGTRGKTTTSHLIHAILKADGRDSILCGNIPGRPTLSLLSQVKPDTVLVVEISSFHLESSAQLGVSPKYGIITNISPDHLNRYDSVEEYAQVKAQLFTHQQEGDHAFYGAHHPWSAILEQSIQTGVTVHKLTEEDFSRAVEFGSRLPGRHNRENIAFAAEVGRALGVPESTIHQAIQEFQGVPFRLETVGSFDGIQFINDTTATTPTALEKALDAMDESFVLIAGGTTKHLPISDSLLEKLRQKPAAIVWLAGSGTDEFEDRSRPVGGSRPKARSLEEAVSLAIESARKTSAGVVLFSPGFASFELFRNEFDRGEQFNTIVRSLGKT